MGTPFSLSSSVNISPFQLFSISPFDKLILRFWWMKNVHFPTEWLSGSAKKKRKSLNKTRFLQLLIFVTCKQFDNYTIEKVKSCFDRHEVDATYQNYGKRLSCVTTTSQILFTWNVSVKGSVSGALLAEFNFDRFLNKKIGTKTFDFSEKINLKLLISFVFVQMIWFHINFDRKWFICYLTSLFVRKPHANSSN